MPVQADNLYAKQVVVISYLELCFVLTIDNIVHKHFDFVDMEEYKKKTNTGDDVLIRIQPASCLQTSDTKPPTAVLLGWIGSRPKHVAKYTQLYEAMGYNTVQTTAPFSVVFPVAPRTTAKFVLSLLRVLVGDDRLTSGGIMFHKFSNGGAVCAPHLSRFFHGLYPDLIKPDDEIVVKAIKDAIAGVIFDSAPVYLKPGLGGRAISEGLGIQPGLVSAIITFIFTLLCLIQRFLVVNLARHFWDGLRDARYMCPELYIYSHEDHLLDVPSLEDLIIYRKRNHDVHVWHVLDAEHVKILRKYPEEYLRTVQLAHEWGINAWRKRVSLPPWPLRDSNNNGYADSTPLQ